MRQGLGLGMGFSGSAPLWTPARLASLAAWYPPKNITTASGKLTAWADNGPHHFDVAQATGAKQPAVATQNGRSGASCLGGTYLVGNAASIITTAYTLAAVLRPTAQDSGSYFFVNRNSVTAARLVWTGSDVMSAVSAGE